MGDQDQCFADIQSAHPHGDYDYVVGSIYFDPDRDLVGESIDVVDLEGLRCLGTVIEQNQALILVSLNMNTVKQFDA